jgi:hypothetical protein
MQRCDGPVQDAIIIIVKAVKTAAAAILSAILKGEHCRRRGSRQQALDGEAVGRIPVIVNCTKIQTKIG